MSSGLKAWRFWGILFQEKASHWTQQGLDSEGFGPFRR